jgi:serine/threonine-protein kinase
VARAHACFNADDPAGAAGALRRALEAAPSLAAAHDLAGRILVEVGVLGEGVSHLERASWLDPSAKATVVDLARGLLFQGAAARFEALLRSLKDDPAMISILAYTRLTMWKGERVHDAVACPPAGNALALFSLESMWRILDTGEVSADDAARLDEIIAGAPPGSRPRRLFLQLKVEQLCFAGRVDDADRALPDVVDAGLLDLAWMDRCPLLAPLRPLPAFAGLRARVADRAAPVIQAWRSA